MGQSRRDFLKLCLAGGGGAVLAPGLNLWGLLTQRHAFLQAQSVRSQRYRRTHGE